MIENNRNQAIQEWLQGSPYVTDLFFNFSPAEPGVTSVAPVSGEQVVQEFCQLFGGNRSVKIAV